MSSGDRRVFMHVFFKIQVASNELLSLNQPKSLDIKSKPTNLMGESKNIKYGYLQINLNSGLLLPN